MGQAVFTLSYHWTMAAPTATRIERDIVMVRGADAGDYLQTQLSQDLDALEVGRSAWTFLLTPKSEVIALMRVTRAGEEEFILDMEPGWGDAVRTTIDEFLFRMDVEFEQASWPGIAWRGAVVESVDAPISAQTPWDGVVGVDTVGPDVRIPDGAELLDASDLEQLRIASGWPAMGHEMDGDVTPAMTGLVGETVGFEKGCYPGQEFVARVHYRGTDPPKRLIRLTFDVNQVVSPGAPIIIDGDEVGQVTSAVSGVALGYLKRGCQTPSTGLVDDVEVRLFATAPR
jgi:folate-binding protein YgfZ